MDTRQLAAFCAVVERRSFSQAAERLGVTQPAVSLQVRALEKRLGQQLLDRSGRRVEPTEAGMRLYRGAQRLLALEEQLVADVAGRPTAELAGTLAIGASTGPGGTVVPLLLCEFQQRHPDVRVALSISDTQHVVELVAERELELGDRRRRAAPPRRRVRAVLPRRGRPRVPAGPPVRRPDGHARRAARGAADRDAGGRRRPPGDRGRAARAPARGCATSTCGSSSACRSRCKSAVVAGYGVTFISRTAVEAELAAGTLAAARVEGLEPAREISLVRAAGRSPTRAAEAFVAFAREELAA